MTIGFIGIGNLATALIKGFKKSGASVNIMGFDIDPVHMNRQCEELNLTQTAGADELAARSDIILLAVKPHQLSSMLQGIKNIIEEKKPLIISLAAGKTLEQIEESLGFKAPVIRVMPNLNASLAESMTAICANDEVSAQNLVEVEKLFSLIGKTIIIDESFFSIFTAVAVCSPAFTYMYIDSLAKAAHKAGLKKSEALKMAAQSVIGSAKLLLESDEHPMAMVDKVCSPGGSTIEGVCVLEENAFQSIVVKAVDASYLKDKRL